MALTLGRVTTAPSSISIPILSPMLRSSTALETQTQLHLALIQQQVARDPIQETLAPGRVRELARITHMRQESQARLTLHKRLQARLTITCRAITLTNRACTIIAQALVQATVMTAVSKDCQMSTRAPVQCLKVAHQTWTSARVHLCKPITCSHSITWRAWMKARTNKEARVPRLYPTPWLRWAEPIQQIRSSNQLVSTSRLKTLTSRQMSPRHIRIVEVVYSRLAHSSTHLLREEHKCTNHITNEERCLYDLL